MLTSQFGLGQFRLIVLVLVTVVFRLEVLNAPTLSLLTGFSARRPTL